jgi:hypothetical protein
MSLSIVIPQGRMGARWIGFTKEAMCDVQTAQGLDEGENLGRVIIASQKGMLLESIEKVSMCSLVVSVHNYRFP